MAKTNIPWTNITWNPVTGCTPISEGCQNCYAKRMHNRLQAMDFKTGKNPKYRADFGCVGLHPQELNKDFGDKPKMIFVNSMSDLFHKNITDDDINDVISTCFCHSKHIFQILTKRSERLNDFSFKHEIESLLNIDSNIWLGVTVELAKYKNRIDDLRKTDAKIKFLSCEPLLGDLGELDLTGIDWCIVGGESGPGARPMHPEWVRNIRNQCIEQHVPFFFKQWGEWVTDWNTQCKHIIALDIEGNRHYPQEAIFEDSNLIVMAKVGKKKAGRELDGKIWDQMPEVVK